MRLLKLLILIIIASCFIEPREAARILAVFPSASFSHQIFFRPVMKALARKGHDVTVVTPLPFAVDEPQLAANLHQIDVQHIRQVWDQTFNADLNELNPISYTFKAIDTSLKMTEAMYRNAEFERLLADNGTTFDAVIVECLGMIATYALGHKYGAPLIGMASFDEIDHRAVGNEWHPIHHAHNSVRVYGENVNIFKRAFALVALAFTDSIVMPYLHFQTNKMIGAIFGTDGYPSAQELRRALDLVLVDAPPALGFTRPILPNTVQLGFVHIEAAKPLPDTLQSFLDKSRHGVIYFSLGSNVKSCQIGANRIQVLIDTFRSMKFDVIWKWEEAVLPNAAKAAANILFTKWAPQQDVLRHPNVRLFIMQGGQQSLEEAVNFGVPVLVFPFFGDQRINAYRVERIGVGKALQLEQLNVKTLKRDIIELTENSK